MFQAIIFNNPNNPLGKVFTLPEIEQICHLCKQHDVLMIRYDSYNFPWVTFGAFTLSLSYTVCTYVWSFHFPVIWCDPFTFPMIRPLPPKTLCDYILSFEYSYLLGVVLQFLWYYDKGERIDPIFIICRGSFTFYVMRWGHISACYW